MGFSLFGKKKEPGSLSSLLDTLPPPPAIDDAQLPPLIRENLNKNIRFPSMPLDNPVKAKKFEKKAYKQEKMNVEQREMLEVLQPLFIKGDLYKELAQNLEDSRADLKKANVFIEKVEDLTALREQEFEELRKNIEAMQRKLIFMDKTLFK
jgi:hypothetical protein